MTEPYPIGENGTLEAVAASVWDPAETGSGKALIRRRSADTAIGELLNTRVDFAYPQQGGWWRR